MTREDRLTSTSAQNFCAQNFSVNKFGSQISCAHSRRRSTAPPQIKFSDKCCDPGPQTVKTVANNCKIHFIWRHLVI